jgi:hypothetical protein
VIRVVDPSVLFRPTREPQADAVHLGTPRDLRPLCFGLQGRRDVPLGASIHMVPGLSKRCRRSHGALGGACRPVEVSPGRHSRSSISSGPDAIESRNRSRLPSGVGRGRRQRSRVCRAPHLPCPPGSRRGTQSGEGIRQTLFANEGMYKAFMRAPAVTNGDAPWKPNGKLTATLNFNG